MAVGDRGPEREERAYRVQRQERLHRIRGNLRRMEANLREMDEHLRELDAPRRGGEREVAQEVGRPSGRGLVRALFVNVGVPHSVDDLAVLDPQRRGDLYAMEYVS